MAIVMLVAGIDLSTAALHVALIPADPDTHGEELPPEWAVRRVPLEVDAAEQPWFAACRRVHRLLDTVDFQNIVAVWVERPVGHSNLMLPLFGAVVALTPVHTSWIWPPEWRSAFCGDARASKDDARKRAIEIGFPTDLTEDAYEAIGIAWGGRQLTMNGVERQEAIEAAAG